MKKSLFLLLGFCAFLFLPIFRVAAGAQAPFYFTFQLESSSVSAGGQVRLEAVACDTETAPAGFRIRIAYDEDKLQYMGTEASGTVKSGTMKTGGDSGAVSCVYVCNTDKGYAPRLSGTTVTFLFQAVPDAPAGRTNLSAYTDQVCDYDGNPLEANDTPGQLSLEVQDTPSSEAYLTDLQPSAGTLEPDFSPSVHSYLISVGSGVETLSFQASAAQGGTVKVSRKTLNAAGKETQITVSVTSADRSQTARYQVFVSRAAKPAATAAETASGGFGASAAGNEKGGGSSAGASATAERMNSAPGAEAPALRAEADQASASIPQGEARQASAETAAPLIIVSDRMPPYLTGMLAAALCITVGIAISLWIPVRRGKS